MHDFNTAIAHLTQLGATVEIYVDAGRDAMWYAERVFLRKDQIDTYAADPVGFMAAHFGVTREQYLAWCEAQGKVYCAAMTGKGNRCKCVVSGQSCIRHAGTWAGLEAKGEYCAIHGGQGAAPA